MIVATLGLIFSFGMPVSAGFGYGAPGSNPPADVATGWSRLV